MKIRKLVLKNLKTIRKIRINFAGIQKFVYLRNCRYYEAKVNSLSIGLKYDSVKVLWKKLGLMKEENILNTAVLLFGKNTETFSQMQNYAVQSLRNNSHHYRYAEFVETYFTD